MSLKWAGLLTKQSRLHMLNHFQVKFKDELDVAGESRRGKRAANYPQVIKWRVLEYLPSRK